MNTASRELCKELYELSGWEDADWFFNPHAEGFTFTKQHSGVPAYDLGYLLRKLPADGNLFVKQYEDDGSWHACSGLIQVEADTPEDAATKLAIALYEQGILKKDPQ